MDGPRSELRGRIGDLLGGQIVSARAAAGGFTSAERWIVELADGRSAFAKVGITPDTAGWVREEHRWCRRLDAPFAPRLLGFDDDGDEPLVVFEDLSAAHWPPPWRAGDIERVTETLGRVARALPDADLARLEDDPAWSGNWEEIARDPGPFLSLRLATPAWLGTALPRLLDAVDAAPLTGPAFVHGDVRSDNLCLLEGRVVLVDWTHPRRGDARFDLASFAPSLRLEGGPLPDEVLPDEPGLAAVVAGYFCARGGLPVVPEAPRARWIQARQARIALPWAARALGLPPPDGDDASRRVDELDEQFRAGAITEQRWYELVEEVLADAYLATDDPVAGSGKTGGTASWRWARELILDAVPPRDGPVHLLDVGCANGHLMESLVSWGAERDVDVEPYGLDISPRLATLARRRLPHWRERIWQGNALTWDAPRSFDVVNLALDCAPPGRQRELVDRAFTWLVPGGRLTFRPDRVVDGGGTAVEALRDLGLEPHGVLEAVHPDGSAVRRMAYLDRR